MWSDKIIRVESSTASSSVIRDPINLEDWESAIGCRMIAYQKTK